MGEKSEALDYEEAQNGIVSEDEEEVAESDEEIERECPNVRIAKDVVRVRRP